MAPLLQKLCAFIVVLAVAVSLTAGASTGAMSGDIASAAGVADVSSPTCDEGDCLDHGMSDAACYAACGGTLAVLSTSVSADLWADQDRYPSAMPAQIGQTNPPDPSPPRSSILS